MKLNLVETKEITSTKTLVCIVISISLWTIAGLNLFQNSVDTAFAQTNSSINNNTTTLAANQQQTGLHPQLVLIIEEQGKITNQRVLAVYPNPIIETTFVANQTILGNIPARDLGTYSATLYTNGSLYGEGNGISTTTNGEFVTWTAIGKGNTNPQGDIRFEGSLFLRTASTGELSYLNNKVAFFEYQVDGQGNTSAEVWEVK